MTTAGCLAVLVGLVVLYNRWRQEQMVIGTYFLMYSLEKLHVLWIFLFLEKEMLSVFSGKKRL